jgi:cytochrome c553
MRRKLAFRLWWPAAFCLLTAPALAEDHAPQGIEFFEKQIRPLLVEHCSECHGADTQESDLRLDGYAGIIRGGASGPAIVPGKPEQSLLLSAVGYADEALQMPPGGKLPAKSIALLKRWIAMGAPHPKSAEPSAPAKASQTQDDLAEARRFWAFQSVVRPAVPAPKRSDWVKSPIDAFVLADLEARQLTPAPPATKRVLIRRATFDLIGLPPTPEEIAAFLADDSPEAFERVVDRLLASPHYGERWGRHWLDVARYADSNGLDENIAYGNAWRYRDYVIDAFNEDKPYDQFLIDQIAGDLIAKGSGDVEPLIATGFLSLGPKVLAEQDTAKLQMDIIDEQIDTFGKAFLGLTLGCARCHDHKFDPISARDYYALAGIFKSTRTMESLKAVAKWNENVVASPEQREDKQRHAARIAATKTAIQAVVDRANALLFSQTGEEIPKDAEKQYPKETKSELKQLRAELKQLEDSAPVLPTAMGVAEAEPVNVRIHVRGSHLTLGEEVARGVPAVLTSAPLEIDDSHSGRLALARWLVDPQNPLTARVMANRLWRWHFGAGIVATPDNFGFSGARPVNQPLLDWLAAEFVESGWSIKHMHRRIMLSNTYRMSDKANAANAAIDPDNSHHWRAETRRLEAEAIRDSLLAVSGLLDAKMGGSLLRVKNREYVFNHTSKDKTTYDFLRRSVYLPVIRNNLYAGFSLFDYAQADVPDGNRATSTIAPQALFMLNGDLPLRASAALAERLLRERPDDARERVRRLYELALGRVPNERETARLVEFARDLAEEFRQPGPNVKDDPIRAAWTAACQAVLASNEFVYVE